jgi:hypothetical protein
MITIKLGAREIEDLKLAIELASLDLDEMAKVSKNDPASPHEATAIRLTALKYKIVKAAQKAA